MNSENANDICVHLRRVTKVYTIESQRVSALCGVDLRVRYGETIALIGKSGAGKSTLLHLIGALDQPSEGHVIVNGIDISKMSDRQASRFRNSCIGFVFQAQNLLPEFSAVENVMMPGVVAGHSFAAVRSRAESLLEDVGLKDRARHRPGELSGGEQQRVAIARALVMKPPILLADEPTGNLDQKTSRGIQDLLLQLCADHNVTMLLVTHDPDLAARLPRQVRMADGIVVGGAA